MLTLRQKIMTIFSFDDGGEPSTWRLMAGKEFLTLRRVVYRFKPSRVSTEGAQNSEDFETHQARNEIFSTTPSY